MPNVQVVDDRYRQEFSTISWVVILSADGTVLATGNTEKGNMGFPQSPGNKVRFRKMHTDHRVLPTADEIHRIFDGIENE